MAVRSDDGGGARERERRAELTAQLTLLGEVSSTETALFHQAAAARYGLGISDMKALSVALREGPVTAGLLALRLSLTTGAVTSVIDRLQRRGLVSRAPDPSDRRKVLVSVNQTALDAGDNVYLSIGQAFSALFESYSLDELEFLTRFYEKSIELTRQEIARLAATGD